MLYFSPAFTIAWCLIAALLGASAGSFLNCVVWRRLHGESPWAGRSHCDLCGHVLGPRDLVPLLSWLFAKGRCRYCGEKLDAGHLRAEAAGAVAFVGILLCYDFSLQTLEYFLFAGVLLLCSLSDLADCTIPDGALLFGAGVWLVFLPWRGELWTTVLDGLIGGIGVGGGLLLLVLLYEKIKKTEAMGGGDIKLLALTGLFLGWKRNILCLLLACILGILFGLIQMKKSAAVDGDDENDSKLFPWGPSICAAAWLCLLGGRGFLDLYLGLFS